MERGEAIGLLLTDVSYEFSHALVGDGLGTTEPRDRRGASHKSSLLEKGGLGFKEPALLTYATLPAYLLGRGRRDLYKQEVGPRGHPTRTKRLGSSLADVHLWLSNGLHFGEDPKVGTTYAPEGMGPRSGGHDGWVRGGALL